ncbi:sister chromatid cohesion protein Dcc1 [Dichotomocladium elegans]|nr:sister chromatid cohesion protein Dcc1 [Dichotomocladium elegans]
MPELIYSATFKKGSYKLLELSSESLVAAIESGTKLVIKGQPEDEAVLCTDTQTFNLTEAPTSNSLILATLQPNGDVNVNDEVGYHIEARPTLPKLRRIDTLLGPTRYNGPEAEQALSDEPKYTFSDLLSLVQASEKELKEGLVMRQAFELDGFCRLVDPAFLYQMLDQLANTATSNDVDLNHIPIKHAIHFIRQYPEQGASIPEPVIMACLATMGDWVDPPHNTAIRLDEYKVCRFVGEYLLCSGRNRDWEQDEFSRIWLDAVKRRVSPTFRPSLDMLRGLYLARQRTGMFGQMITYITYFPVHELPIEPVQRFARLFAENKLWTADAIAPYIEDLDPDKKKREALLVKFTRSQRTKDNGMVYSSRIK